MGFKGGDMSKTPRKTGKFTAAMEALEGRQLLSASLAKGVLKVSGSSGDDVIRIAKSSTSIQVSINGAAQTFKASTVNKLRILAGAGNDSVAIGPSIPSRISGGPGNDNLTGSKAADSIDGGDGDDVINGRGGNDTLVGGAGNDNLIGLTGNDSILGGDGRDNLSGGAGNDLLNGEAEADTVSGGAGTDLDIDQQDRLVDPDSADQNLNLLFGAFPGLANTLFPNGTGNTGGLGDIFGNGGNIFGGGGGSIFG
jgi:Ca2+-binding RTX toxin-like protein